MPPPLQSPPPGPLFGPVRFNMGPAGQGYPNFFPAMSPATAGDWNEYSQVDQFDILDPGDPWPFSGGGMSPLPAGPEPGVAVPGWSPTMNYAGNPIDYTSPGVQGFGAPPPWNNPFGGVPAAPNFGQMIGQGMAQGAGAAVGQMLPQAGGLPVPNPMPPQTQVHPDPLGRPGIQHAWPGQISPTVPPWWQPQPGDQWPQVPGGGPTIDNLFPY